MKITHPINDVGYTRTVCKLIKRRSTLLDHLRDKHITWKEYEECADHVHDLYFLARMKFRLAENTDNGSE